MEGGLDFEIKEYPFEGITDKITTLDMKWFVRNPDSIIESIVQEFYVNVPDATNNKDMVRGVLVPFDLSDKNVFLWIKGC